jgi:hypothetical protein
MLTREQRVAKGAEWLAHWCGWQSSAVSMAEYARREEFDADAAYRWRRRNCVSRPPCSRSWTSRLEARRFRAGALRVQQCATRPDSHFVLGVEWIYGTRRVTHGFDHSPGGHL